MCKGKLTSFAKAKREQRKLEVRQEKRDLEEKFRALEEELKAKHQVELQQLPGEEDSVEAGLSKLSKLQRSSHTHSHLSHDTSEEHAQLRPPTKWMAMDTTAWTWREVRVAAAAHCRTQSRGALCQSPPYQRYKKSTSAKEERLAGRDREGVAGRGHLKRSHSN